VSLGSKSTWKYLDNGTAPSAWTQLSFDDSLWKSGPAPLGYGEPRIRSEVRGAADGAKPVTVWFRRVFEVPELKAGERTVLVFSADDGAVAYLNGREFARFNLPSGPLTPTTTASHELADEKEGFYYRAPIPDGLIRPHQKNVIAIEVHQVAVGDGDLFFDAALKTVTGNLPAPGMTAAAEPVMTMFLQKHYLGPQVRIPDGYFDGGRFMLLGADGVSSRREILLVDRTRDTELSRHLAYARSEVARGVPTIERVQHIAAYIDRATTPPGGERLVGRTIEQLTHEFVNKPLLIGDVLDQCQAGVCRHRALLFKLMADDAGLKAALVRGNYAKGTNGFPHAWNEVFLEDGRRVLVDVMHHGAKPVFPEVSAEYVVKHYRKEDNTPWYQGKPTPPRS
jgi:hypothetical protein